MPAPKDIFAQYIVAINAHKAEKLSALIGDDHSFIDPQGRKAQGKAAMMEVWAKLFAFFPDYQLSIDEAHEVSNTVLAFGKAMGSAGEKKSADNSFALPTAIRCGMEGEKVISFQLIADTKIPSEITDRTQSLSKEEKQRVLGFGGVFFKAKDPKALAEWYDNHLGTSFGSNQYQTFKWRDRNRPGLIGRTEFSLFNEGSDYFDPSESRFMFNFRVADLDALLAELAYKGVTIVGEPQSFDYGKFGWIMDAEDNKIELWQPVDDVLEDYDATNKA